MVPDPRLSFLFYCTLFFISGKINKYERQYKAACLLKLTVSSDPYTSTQTARPRPAGAWRGRNSGSRTWWPCIFRCCSSARGLPTGSGISFCSRRALRGSDSGNYSSRGAESCCFHKPSTLERLDLRVCPFKFLPQFFRIGRRIFRLLQITQNLRIFKFRGDHGSCGGS